MSQFWAGWRESLHIVQPETVVRWHRQGFRYYWRWKSRHRGRPRIDPEIRQLIRRMCRANPLWGAPRIHSELLKLGIDVSVATVSKIHDQAPWTAFPDLADVSYKPCQRYHRAGFLHSSNCNFPDSFCPDHSEPRSSADTARQCDGASDIGLDCAAAISGVRLRRGAPISAA